MFSWLRNLMRRQVFQDVVLANLAVALCRLEVLERKVDELMGVANDIKALLTQIDAATTAVANRLADLAGRITNSMSDAEVTEIKTQMAAKVDRLTALGHDPNNPVPTP